MNINRTQSGRINKLAEPSFGGRKAYATRFVDDVLKHYKQTTEILEIKSDETLEEFKARRKEVFGF